MKTLITALFTGITLALASSAFAGLDQAQIMQQERAIKALQAERLALAKRAQQGRLAFRVRWNPQDSRYEPEEIRPLIRERLSVATAIPTRAG